jgi:hypothetical protein
MFEQFAFLLAFGAAGYCDLKTLTVPELLSAVLWLLVLFPPFSITTAGFAFALAFAFTAMFEFNFGEPWWGWADTLAAGPFIAALMSFPSLPDPYNILFGAALFSALVVAAIMLRRKRKKKTGVPFVFLEAVALLFVYLSSLL